MVSRKDNETLTRVGPGSVMGSFMRQFWVPACLSKELEPDGEPMRLMLLGEKLIAFRDTEGRVGILDQRCPHRCASLYFGRNEKGGLRCVYHGWKFDAEGKCVDMPNVPAKNEFSQRVRAKAYRTAERNGLVFVYMGDAETPPPLPELDALMFQGEDIRLGCVQRECNWLQVLEGDIDTSHFGFLHLGSVPDEDVDLTNLHSATVLNRAPEYFYQETDWGTMYCAHRPDHEPDTIYYRFAHFHFPFWTQFPDGTFENNVVAVAHVPMDDTHTMVFYTGYSKRTPGMRRRKDGTPVPGLEIDASGQLIPMLPNTNDWYGRWRTAFNRSNDYMLDRDAQRSGVFTGIQSVQVQDQAMVESMGDIVDRELEHLAPSDIMVARTRRRILQAARAFAETGELPALHAKPELSRGTRSGAFKALAGQSWLDAYSGALAREPIDAE